jgi:hypothetical protein
MSSWFDIREAQRRQEETARRLERIEIRSAAAAAAAAEEAAAKNNKPKIIWNDQDFQIALNAFTRYMHNPNDGEWARWSRDVREKHE